MNLERSDTPNWGQWRNEVIKQFETALAAGSESFAPEQEDVHRFRAALKFARALLRLAPPSIARETEQIRHELGKTARRLSAIRDQFIFIETLHALSKRSFDAPASSLNSSSIKTLIGAKFRLAKLRKQFETLATPTDDADELFKSIHRCKQRLHHRRPKDWIAAPASHIHAYRSALVVAACQGKFLNTLTGHPKKSKLDKLNRLRRHLGEFNDLDRFHALLKTRPFKAFVEKSASIIPRARQRQKALRHKLEKMA